MSFSKISLIAILIVAVAGCAKKYESVPFAQPQAGAVQRIAIVTPSMPSGPTAWLATTVGQSFGLLGALIDAGMQASRNDSLEDLLAGQSFQAQESLIAELTSSLESKGYEVVTVPRPATTGKREFLKTYPTSTDQPVDAFLDVIVVGYGYGAAGITSGAPYRPIIYTQNRLVSASTNSILMKDDVLYNPIGLSRDNERVTISPASEYSFTDFDALESNPSKTTEGLTLAFTQTASTISALMK
jgi:hypothetical protein